MPDTAKWGIALLVGVGLVSLGWRFTWVLTALHVLICVILVLVVLLQSGKAADLAGAFGGSGSQTAFGPRGATTFLSKATQWCAIMFVFTTISLGLRQPTIGSGSIIEGTKPAQSEPAPSPTVPPAGQATPEQTPPAQAPTQQPAPATQTPPPAPTKNPPPKQ